MAGAIGIANILENAPEYEINRVLILNGAAGICDISAKHFVQIQDH